MKKNRFFKKFIKCSKGAISVFLSLVLTGVFSLSALVMEAGRYRTAQQILDEAAITSAMSSLANMDSTLQKRFGLYGVKTKGGKDSTTAGYMKTNSDADAKGISSLYKLNSTESNWTYDLANYSVLERQILEHEKYRAPLEIVEGLLDLDSVIKNFIKEIENLIPALKEILNICDAICDIVDGLKALYSLTKTIQQLEMSTVAGAPELDEKFAEITGEAWGTIEEFFGGEDWDKAVADPSYYEAYNALEKAIDEKIKYLKEHSPAPEAPATARPSVDSGLKTKADELSSVGFVIQLFVDLDYFDDSGLISGDCAELYEKVKSSVYKKQLNYITDTTDRSRLLVDINRILSKYNLSQIKEDDNKTAVENYADNVKRLGSNYNGRYNSQVSAQNLWDTKSKAYEDYQKKVKKYNKNINTAVSNLKSALTKIGSLLNTYKTNYNKAVAALEKATQAVSNMQNSMSVLNKNGDWQTGDITKLDLGGIEKILNELKRVAMEPADEGIAFVANQKAALDSLSGSNIDKNYGSLSSHKNLGKGKMANYKKGQPRYYLTKTKMAGLLAALEGISLVESYNSQLLTVLDSFKQLQQAFGVLPATNDDECSVTLSSDTTKLFPSKTGTNSEANNISSDVNAVRSYLNEARTLLGSIYDDEIGLVDPDNTAGVGLSSEELATRIGRIADNCQKLSGEQDSLVSKLANAVFGFIGTIFKLFTNINTIVQIVQDVIYVATHIKDVFTELPSMLGESVLLSQFAVTKFSNRLDKVKGENGVGKSFNGKTAKAVDSSAQTFSQANVEYIIIGGDSETTNQQACFNRIMAIRMLNNAFLIATDDMWRELISACNIFAPVVFILLMYYESNIDMNLLIKLKLRVPLIKTSLVLSIDSLTDPGGMDGMTAASEDLSIGLSEENNQRLEIIDKDLDLYSDSNTDELNQFYAQKEISQTTKKLLENLEKGQLKIKYKHYLFFFMLLQSNRQKLSRMADLIQMELRYNEYSKGSKPTVLLEDYHTFIRVKSKASLNPVLPIISFNKDGNKSTGWPLGTIKYVGY